VTSTASVGACMVRSKGSSAEGRVAEVVRTTYVIHHYTW
jgi:hypothetical protein